MDISVIRKRFLLAGYEVAMDFNKGFKAEMQWVRGELERSIDRIGGKTEPMRLVGFWQPYRAFLETPDETGAAKAKYFFGIEISGLESIPSDCVVRVIAESAYAVYREASRGSAPKAEMYEIGRAHV